MVIMKRELHPPIYKMPKTLSQSIYYYLKDAILKGKFKPGTKINEKEIAEIFQVSKTPIREAIVKLAAEGFVEITSHRESAVKEVSFKELREIFQVIGILDSVASTLVIDKIDSNEFLKLEKMTNKMECYLHQNNVEKYIDINYAIHDKIWNHLTNINIFLQKKLRDFVSQIKMHKSYALNSAFRNSKIINISMKSHKEILKALKIKDKKKLKTIILEHWIPPLP